MLYSGRKTNSLRLVHSAVPEIHTYASKDHLRCTHPKVFHSSHLLNQQERRARMGEPRRLQGEEAREPGGEARAEGGQDAGHRHRRLHRLLAPILRPRPHDGNLHGRYCIGHVDHIDQIQVSDKFYRTGSGTRT